MGKPFRKDLGNVSWQRVYERQALRAGLVPGWMDALKLEPGGRVLEIGAGPGFVSFALAERVGPSGMVYAVDRSAEALAYLARLQQERGVAQIRPIAADAATLEGTDLEPDCALITMVLHHTDHPAGILRNVTRLVPPAARVVIGEFDPKGPCEVGPPRASRLAFETLAPWCAVAGLSVLRTEQQTSEHYLAIAERRA